MNLVECELHLDDYLFTKLLPVHNGPRLKEVKGKRESLEYHKYADEPKMAKIYQNPVSVY